MFVAAMAAVPQNTFDSLYRPLKEPDTFQKDNNFGRRLKRVCLYVSRVPIPEEISK